MSKLQVCIFTLLSKFQDLVPKISGMNSCTVVFKALQKPTNIKPW